MEFYLPSLFLFVLALGFSIYIVPKMTPFVLIVLTLTLLILAGWNHYMLFKDQYMKATWLTTAQGFAPFILIGIVVAMSIGYVLYLFGAGKSINLPSRNRAPEPPPNTATNMITETMGNVMNNFGLTESNLVSRSPNLEATNSEIRNVARSRLAEQV